MNTQLMSVLVAWLVTGAALASGILITMDKDISVADKQKIKPEFRKVFKDNGPEIKLWALPVWYKTSNTNKERWILQLDDRGLKNMGVNLTNITIAKINEKLDNLNLDNRNAITVHRVFGTNSVPDMMRAAGWEARTNRVTEPPN